MYDRNSYSIDDESCLELHKQITILAALPHGQAKAMECLVQLIRVYSQALDLAGAFDNQFCYESGCETHRWLQTDLAEMAHSHFVASRTHDIDWDPAPLLEQIMDAIPDLCFGQSGDQYLEAKWYLRKWHSWRTARMLATKVAGQLLPPELVEMIEEDIYDDIDLTISAGKWVWSCGAGCDRAVATLTEDCDDDEFGNCRLSYYYERQKTD